MIVQRCIVKNKAQLIVALGCTMDTTETTIITLVLKNGKRVNYYIVPPHSLTSTTGWATYGRGSYNYMQVWNSHIKKAINRTRKIPAVCFK